MNSVFAHVDINTLVLVFIGLGLALQQWRSGSSKITKDTVEAYKARLEIMEKNYQTQQETLTKQAGQIGELNGLIAGKDAQIADYRKILENRNPNLEKILDQLVAFMHTIDTRLTEIATHQKKPFVADTHTVITK